MGVPHAQELRHEPAHHSNQQAARNGLDPERFSRQTKKSLPHSKKKLGEDSGHKAADNAEDGVHSEFPGIHQLVLRNLKKRIVPEQQPEHGPRSCRGQDDGAQHGCVKIPDYLFESKQHSRYYKGVLNAAAIAAAAPTGIRAFTFSGRNPMRRPRTDAIPAPTCTAGPSRPRGIPLASVADVQKNFPSTVRRLMRPSRANSAALVCGTPLPRASGK